MTFLASQPGCVQSLQPAAVPTDLCTSLARCPKHMRDGPCGGIAPDGSCEADAALTCPYLAALAALPWRNPCVPAGRPPPRSAGRLEAALRAGSFVVIAEAYTPDSADLSGLVARYAALAPYVTAVNIAEHALASPHAATLAAAALLERAGVETIVNMTCRDRNRIAAQGDLLGAAAVGVKNVFCVTGDHPCRGDDRGARGVYDLDSFGLIRLARQLCDTERLVGGRRLETPPRLFVGAAANPFSPPYEVQAERVAAKVVAGADFIQTQAVFDLPALGAFIDQLHAFKALDRAWLIVGVAIITSLEQARWLQRDVPGARVPDALVDRLATIPAQRQRAYGLDYTLELIQRLRLTPGVSGVLLFPLHGDIDSLAELVPRLEPER